MERLAAFAATKLGKWIIGAGVPALGVFVSLLINSVSGLGLSDEVSILIGSLIGSIAARLGIPSPPKEERGVSDAL